jgi:hypothetical protein
LKERARVRDAIAGTRAYAPALLSPYVVPSHRFVILTAGRAGSELLVSLLDSHPRICCASEILKDARVSPNRYVAARATMARIRGMDAFGWKLVLSHFRAPDGTVAGVGDPATYPARLASSGWRLIVLVRRNPVRQAISFIVGADRKFHYRRGEAADFAPIAIDPVRLLAATWIIETETQVLLDFVDRVPHLPLVYEDDLLDPARHQSTVDRVCEYVGVAGARVQTELVKPATSSLCDLMSNFDEVRGLLGSTRFARYLEPGDG